MKGLLIHYVIGISAVILLLVTAYRLNENPNNLFSGGIIILAMTLVAVGQYATIKHKKKQR